MCSPWPRPHSHCRANSVCKCRRVGDDDWYLESSRGVRHGRLIRLKPFRGSRDHVWSRIFFTHFSVRTNIPPYALTLMEVQRELVQNDPNNPYETALARAYNAVCKGQTIFMDGAGALQTAEAQLNAGSLTEEMRVRFVHSILTVCMPILEGPFRLGDNLCFARERLEAPRELANLIRRRWEFPEKDKDRQGTSQ